MRYMSTLKSNVSDVDPCLTPSLARQDNDKVQLKEQLTKLNDSSKQLKQAKYSEKWLVFNYALKV